MSGDDKTTAQPREAFSLKRWSRVKREAARAERPAVASPAAEASAVAAPPAATATVASAPATEPAPLPSVESLTFDSDFTAFLRPQVDEGVKREALKKLFSDPRFNVMDGLDVYIDDYTKPDLLAPDIARALADACSILEPPASAADAASSAVAANAGAPAPEQRDAAAASASPPAQIEAETPPSEAPEQAREPVSAPRAGDAPSKPR